VKTLDGTSDVIPYMAVSTNVVPVVSTFLSDDQNCDTNQNNTNVIPGIKPTEKSDPEPSESSPDREWC
jgi:hypothetical protein